MKLSKIAFVVASLAASSLASAAGQTSANFAMPLDSINNGVGQMSSVNFTLSSSIKGAVVDYFVATENNRPRPLFFPT